MSAALLQRKDLQLYMVDNWKGIAGHEGYGSWEQAHNFNQALLQTRFADSRRIVLPFDSVYAASLIPGEDKDFGQLDFVFIDANHYYDFVLADINVWLPKLKKGGLLGGHDYNNPRGDWGKDVKRAVDEMADGYGWDLDLGANTCWFVRV